jgi:hypothetical protein
MSVSQGAKGGRCFLHLSTCRHDSLTAKKQRRLSDFSAFKSPRFESLIYEKFRKT